MALDTAGLKTGIKAAFLARIPAPTGDQISAMDALAGDIATAMTAFVKTANISYTTGLVDASGAVTGVFGNTIT